MSKVVQCEDTKDAADHQTCQQAAASSNAQCRENWPGEENCSQCESRASEVGAGKKTRRKPGIAGC